MYVPDVKENVIIIAVLFFLLLVVVHNAGAINL